MYTDPTGEIITVDGINVLTATPQQLAQASPATIQALQAVQGAIDADQAVANFAANPNVTDSVTTAALRTYTNGSDDSPDATTHWSDSYNQSEYLNNNWNYNPAALMDHELTHALDHYSDWQYRQGQLTGPPMLKDQLKRYTNKHACDQENKAEATATTTRHPGTSSDDFPSPCVLCGPRRLSQSPCSDGRPTTVADRRPRRWRLSCPEFGPRDSSRSYETTARQPVPTVSRVWHARPGGRRPWLEIPLRHASCRNDADCGAGFECACGGGCLDEGDAGTWRIVEGVPIRTCMRAAHP